MRVYQYHAGDDAKLLIKFCWPNTTVSMSNNLMAPHSLCYNKKTKQITILILKGSRNLSDKKL